MDEEVKKHLESVDTRLASIEEKQEKIERSVEKIRKSSSLRWTWLRTFAGVAIMGSAIGFAVTDSVHPAVSVALFAFGLVIMFFVPRR